MKDKTQGTGISWTHQPGYRGETWTVIRGCELPPGRKTCVDCYAMVQAHSLVTRNIDTKGHYEGLTKKAPGGPVWTGRVNFDEHQLLWPLHCTKPRCFFLTSMGDVFYGGVTDQQIALIFAVTAATPRHRYLVLTKRPERMAMLLNSDYFRGLVIEAMHELSDREGSPFFDNICKSGYGTGHDVGGPRLPANVWWGSSIDDAASAKPMLDPLLELRTPNVWTSYEPMIEEIDLAPWLPRLAWVVVGGASKQRLPQPWPFNTTAAARVVKQCQARGTPVFVKQLGANPLREVAGAKDLVRVQLAENNNHNDNPEFWPKALRVQEWPRMPA